MRREEFFRGFNHPRDSINIKASARARVRDVPRAVAFSAAYERHGLFREL